MVIDISPFNSTFQLRPPLVFLAGKTVWNCLINRFGVCRRKRFINYWGLVRVDCPTIVKREPSTLEVQVAHIVRMLTAIALSMGVLVFLLTSLLVGMDVRESFIFAIGIIVALIPEGLLPTVTLSLAIGVQRMVHHHALVRRLSAVETLSAITVICTDKTGTLTKNEMTAQGLWIPWQPEDTSIDSITQVSNPPIARLPLHHETLHTHSPIPPPLIEVTGAGYDPTSGAVQIPKGFQASWNIDLLLIGAALCSNARLIHLTTPSRWQEIGDPTEAALLVVAAKAMTLASVVACQTGNVFACRSERAASLRLGLFSNPLIWGGIALEWVLVLLITHNAFLQRFLGR